MDRLGPLDAVFVEAEDGDRHVSMAIASIAIFDGPAPSYDELVAAYASKLPVIPRYRQKVQRIPLNLGRPVWVDDPQFDLRYHLRRTALPAPGGDAELCALMARVMDQRLDRDRPLWEAWLVEGLSGGRWGLISKVHHCMVDGIAGTELYHLLLSLSPDDVTVEPNEEPWLPKAPPTSLRLLADGVVQVATRPVSAMRLLGYAAKTPPVLISRSAGVLRGLAALSGAAVPVQRSSLGGRVGQQRRYTATVQRLDDIKTISHHFGVTVNDVALAAVTAAFRALLDDRAEPPAAHTIRSLVPVSVRLPGAEGELANQVSCLLAELPVEIDDPVERLLAVHEEIYQLKLRREAEAGEFLVELADLPLYGVFGPLVRAALNVPQHSIVTVTTNVPGPREPLYLLGRRMLRMLPYVPIADQVRVGVAILSYHGELAFGVTGDYDGARDIDILAEVIGQDIHDLLRAAGPAARAVPDHQPPEQQPADGRPSQQEVMR